LRDTRNIESTEPSFAGAVDPRVHPPPMTLRTFNDPDGVAWTVWEVVPDVSRSSQSLPDLMVGGWLCFQCGDVTRRFYPLPPDWSGFSEAEMWLLLRAAVSPQEQRDGMDPA
jgi:hypothetical protein